MKTALLPLLVCPADHTGLTMSQVAPSQSDTVLAGELTCTLGHTFPITDGVPRVLSGTPEFVDQSGTARTFAAKWEMLHEGDDDARLTRFQHQWFEERFGWPDETALRRFLDGRERILEVGCGRGQDVARYARLSDAQIIGLDLSDVIFRANRDVRGFDNVHFLQGDILAPPFLAETFDFIAADQVLHHTPDAERAFHTLADLLRPNGQIAVYVYRKKALMRELADDHVRALTTALSVDDCIDFSAQMTALGRELSKLDAVITLEDGVPLLGIEPGSHDVQRLIYWHFLKCFWNPDLGERLSTLVNFDWYHPPYASRHTREEVEGWCEQADLDVVHLGVVESGISVRAVRR
jgi:SAM-dependent methyltransferase/uncharacterized protein YbaR (Trm112 family)